MNNQICNTNSSLENLVNDFMNINLYANIDDFFNKELSDNNVIFF